MATSRSQWRTVLTTLYLGALLLAGVALGPSPGIYEWFAIGIIGLGAGTSAKSAVEHFAASRAAKAAPPQATP